MSHRILIISDAWEPQVNGVVRTYQYLARTLEAMGHVVRVLGPHEFPLTVPMPGYAEIRLAIRPRKLLYRVMDEFRPDLVHIGTEGPLGWAARDWCTARGHPFTTAYHTHFPAYVAKRARWAGAWLAGWATRLTTHYLLRFHRLSRGVLVSTPTLARALADQGLKAPTILMTRGIDTAIFEPNGPRADLALAGPVALYVGRVAVEKNIDHFLTMSWHGSKVVVGDGPLRTRYQRQHPNVYFAGLRTGAELASFYRAADVFVFPSTTDTFGMVVTEALACGVPVAAYPVPGPADIITAPALGVLDHDLSAAATRALTSGLAAERFAHILDHYTWPLAAQQFLAAHPWIESR
jgi:glycosyltransferase involved in cell wall biosynthesis